MRAYSPEAGDVARAGAGRGPAPGEIIRERVVAVGGGADDEQQEQARLSLAGQQAGNALGVVGAPVLVRHLGRALAERTHVLVSGRDEEVERVAEDDVDREQLDALHPVAFAILADEGHDRDGAGQDEQAAGHDPAGRPVQQPADIGGELLRLRPRQQHAVVERVQEAALGDPAPPLDQLLVDRGLGQGAQSGGAQSGHPQKVALADRHAVVSQDRVGRRHVKVEVGQRVVQQEGLAREAPRAAVHRERDRPVRVARGRAAVRTSAGSKRPSACNRSNHCSALLVER